MNLKKIKKIICLTILVSLLSSTPSYAMSSESYQVPKDSVNFNGSEDSASGNYRETGTGGEIGTGELDSTNFKVESGYRQSQKETPTFAFNISGNSINFGTLTTTAVATGNIIATTTTNSLAGYSTTLVEDGELRNSSGQIINDVLDGSVTMGVSEYGISTNGSDGLYNSSDTNITTSSKSIAQNTGPANNNSTTISFKAAISGATAAGHYSHKVTIISLGNF